MGPTTEPPRLSSALRRRAEHHLAALKLARPTDTGVSTPHPRWRAARVLPAFEEQAQGGGAAPPLGYTHIVEEGAGVDGHREALGPCALRPQAVQHLRHCAHEVHHHGLAVPEEAVEEVRQLSAEQASLGVAGVVGAVGRGLPGPKVLCPPPPALLVGPRTNSGSPSNGPP